MAQSFQLGLFIFQGEIDLVKTTFFPAMFAAHLVFFPSWWNSRRIYRLRVRDRRQKKTFSVYIFHVLNCWYFRSVRFLIRFEPEWYIAMKFLLPLKPTAGSRSDSDWHIFSAAKRRHDAGFLAFHKVKCISEHFSKISLYPMIAHLQKSSAQFLPNFLGIPWQILFDVLYSLAVSNIETKTDWNSSGKF